MLKGIDISSHNKDINWELVKSQIDFAIIRLGYGDNDESQDDSYFIKNVNGCINNNIPFGVYIYSYATNLVGNASIQSEIEHTKRQLSKISQKPFCVYIDMEDDSTVKLGKNQLTNFALEYCKEITKAGYKVGVYANENWFNNYLDCSKIASYGYSLWVAKYSDNKPNISCNYDIWQYTSEGRINGINTVVDMNNMYNSIIDYKPTPKPKPSNEVNVYYRVKTQKHGWLSEVKNLTDYAGWENSPITDVAIRVDKGSIKYRVSPKGKDFLPYVTGCNINDSKMGYAGNGTPIDRIEAYYYTPNDIRPCKKIKYRVNELPWQYDNEKTNGQDGYGGIIGKNITKLEMIIE